MVSLEHFNMGPTAWCPGCGNFGILDALKKALVRLGKAPHEILIVSGIGQAGKLSHYLRCNGFNGLHGRTLPVATGAKIANPQLTVIVAGGDGDGYAEGGNHFIHSARRNVDLTYLVHDNKVYGLTKGQASPTSELGTVTKTTPQGTPEAINPLALALAAGCCFVARGFSGDQDHLAGLIENGIKHKGFSFIDILQPCVSFNNRNTFAWYRNRVYKLEDTGYSPNDRMIALEKAYESDDHLAIGILYREEKQVFEDRFEALASGPLVDQPISPAVVEQLLEEFV